MPLTDKLNNAIDKGTNAVTLGAVYYDKVTQNATKFGLIKPEESPKPKPREDTGIRPITDFISTIKQSGIAKTNHFTFSFLPPFKTDVFGDMNTSTRMFNLMCSHTTLPGVNIATNPSRTFGEQFEFPNDKIYDPVSTVFYVDAKMHVKKLFDLWTEVIQDPRARTFNFMHDYSAHVVITVFDRNSRPQYMVVLEDAFPKTMGEVSLGHDVSDIMRLNVTWSYRRWSSWLIDNDIHKLDGPVNTERKPSVHERLMGYVGDFKDYQHRFNNLMGDINRSKEMIKNKDWGGLVGQNFGGAVF